VIDALVLKIRRRETPFYDLLYRLAKASSSARLPLPRAANPVLRLLYSAHQGTWSIGRALLTFFYREPLFRGRCESIGKRLTLTKMPYVLGHTKIYIGDDVNFFGKVDIFSGRIFDEPKLILGNRVDVGHGVSFVVNKEITIEDDVNIASNVSFMDTDSHPRDVEDRIADLPPKPNEIRPVRVCRGAWIGHRSSIMKGVTIGEAAIIGASSVVITDVPPFSVAMGNPAKVVIKNTKGVEKISQ
jgi:acetyltransferase-like isoleucine patch superfamily enzyme